MPRRILPFINKEIYHVYNRGIDYRPTFLTPTDYSRALETIKYYRYQKPPIRFAYFQTLSKDRKIEILNLLQSSMSKVDIIAYCLMPNHFHLCVSQMNDNGIQRCISNFQNSYTKFFNMKRKRQGALFLDQFKAVRIETEEQLIHVIRYIHLNPYTGYVVKNFDKLIKYRWSSYKEYVEKVHGLCNKEIFMNYFSRLSQIKKFHEDEADYQRKLDHINHLLWE